MAVTASDIRNAADLMVGQIIRTPFVTAPMLSRTLGCELMLKLENLQHTSSFKARGAFMAMQALVAEERQRGSPPDVAVQGVVRKIPIPDEGPGVPCVHQKRFAEPVSKLTPDRIREETVAPGRKVLILHHTLKCGVRPAGAH